MTDTTRACGAPGSLLSDTVRTAHDARATRLWLEAELSAVLPAHVVDAIVSTVAEFLVVACLPEQPAEVTVRGLEDEVRLDVLCRASDIPELDELARRVLAGSVDDWGLGVSGDHVRLWARISLL